MKKNIFLLILVIFALALSSLTMAADPTGSEVADISSSRATATSSEAVNATAGNVTQVNINADAITANWAGFWGNITTSMKLGDVGNTFYEWTVSSLVGGVVYASNGSISTWDLAAAANGDMPASINGTDTDNFTSTFSGSGTPTLLGNVMGATPEATTEGSVLNYALTADTGSSLVWAAMAQDSAAGFNTQDLNFELIVPADAGNTEYSFYFEIP